MDKKIDIALVNAYILEISDRIKLILDLIPGRNECKHLTSSSIHLALFIKDLIDNLNGDEIIIEGNVKRFIEECGCDFNKERK